MTNNSTATQTASLLEAIATSSISPREAFACLREPLLSSADGELTEKIYEALRSQVWSSVSNREAGDVVSDWADFALRLRQLLRSRSSPVAERFTVLADFLEQSNRFARLHPSSELLTRKHVRTILEVLFAHGPRTTRAAVAQATKLRDANLSRILTNLASAGWIKRQNEGREVLLTLTEEGAAHVREALPPAATPAAITPFTEPVSLEVIRTFWEKTNCAVAVSDNHKGVLSCDRNFASIFGVDSPEVLVGTDVTALRKAVGDMVDGPEEVVPDEVSLMDGRTWRVVEFEAGSHSLWLSFDVTPYKRQLEECRRRERFLLTQIERDQRHRPLRKTIFAGVEPSEVHDASWPVITALRSDLLTPINSINTFAQLLSQDHLHSSRKAIYSELVSGIIDQSAQLRTLLRDIVNVGELFASSSLKADKVQPTVLVDSVLSNFDYTTRHALLSFSRKVTPKVTVETNERALRGVMFQAVSGIVEMMPNGGQVGIETELENDVIVMRVFTRDIEKEIATIGVASKTLVLCEQAVRFFGGEFDFSSRTSDGVSAKFSWPISREKRARTDRVR